MRHATSPQTPKEMTYRMARFVSHYKNYNHGVQEDAPEYLGHDGKMVPAKRYLAAQFSHSSMDPEAIAIAKLRRSEGGLASDDPNKPPFHGMQENESGRELPIEPRLAAFDSEVAQLREGWSDKDRILVEDTLRKSPRYGVDFVEVIPAPAGKPWRGYDEVTDPERVVELALAIDADLANAIKYEKENANRPEVLKALTEAHALVEENEVVIHA